ncbi:mobilization protein [Porphyromonas gingivalis SJD2]|uniref:toprim domain-containing protein n=1 Tax=Porphyromonas gingivalis TaxID=837 RepID=UPI0003D1BA9A|nr:toprim domain-containing protein [Porphyromonas gingivalis]ETA25849.1 mobilization protein [Porphyromonas gingivalis SJD2]OWR75573.1 mobilization protein [Porphyromonas gingivalis SJD5]PDP46776.1 mobilization protein [Porphyromonas gingivalis]
MDIQHIKQIPITDYLQQQGYTPTRVQGVHYWYGSPLRKDNTPSFKVNTERNQWYDFDSGEHGDIIDLVCALHRCTISEAIGFLSGTKQVAHQEFSFGGDRKFSERKLEILSAQPLSNPNLLRYLAARAIPLSIASTYCSEVLFQNMKRTYYAIGFANDALGWEIRNMYFKGCIAPKAVTTIKRGADRLQIFEGFMDFLSWQTLNPSSTCDAIVLNSLALLPRIKEQIAGYREVESFLDNDDAGHKSFAVLKQMLPQIVDGAVRYREHKDLNEWLVAQSQLKCKQPLLPTTKRGIRR